MKGFIIATCLFFVMTAAIFGGKTALTKFSDNLLKDVEEIKAESSDRIEKLLGLQSLWSKRKDLVQISATHKRTEAVTDLIDTLYVYAIRNEESEYQKTAELLLNAITEIRQFEEFSAVNIL